MLQLYRCPGRLVCTHAYGIIRAMSVLIGNDLSKRFGPLDVFQGVDLRVKKGDRMGLARSLFPRLGGDAHLEAGRLSQPRSALPAGRSQRLRSAAY